MSQASVSAPCVRVLMVCLGNICRSPTAHAVLEKYIDNKGMTENIKVDSAGTGDWHIGAAPDRRSTAAAARRGYDLSALRARQVQPGDFQYFDYILAMDRQNLKELRALSPPAHKGKLRLLLDYADNGHDAVPDPYYSGQDGFELVLDLVEQACERLLHHIIQEHQLNNCHQ